MNFQKSSIDQFFRLCNCGFTSLNFLHITLHSHLFHVSAMSVAAPANQLAPLPIEKITSLPSEDTATIGLDDVDLSGCDEEQIRLMNEMCIVVDENDKPIGIGTKKACTSAPQL